MKKYIDIIKLFFRVLRGREQLEYIEEHIDDSFDIYDKNAPINIPPEVYKKICKELKTENIKFMGIT